MAAAGERVYVGMGSNLQGPERQLERAWQLLQDVPGLSQLGASARYRSAPWGNPEQPDFVNSVVAFTCTLAPCQLLNQLLEVERSMGRTRTAERWTPRSIDLDLLYFGDRRLDTSTLTVPHPHLQVRAFVLVPLVELASKLADSRLLLWQADLSRLAHDDVVRLQPEFGPPVTA